MLKERHDEKERDIQKDKQEEGNVREIHAQSTTPRARTHTRTHTYTHAYVLTMSLPAHVHINSLVLPYFSSVCVSAVLFFALFVLHKCQEAAPAALAAAASEAADAVSAASCADASGPMRSGESRPYNPSNADADSLAFADHSAAAAAESDAAAAEAAAASAASRFCLSLSSFSLADRLASSTTSA